MFDRKAWSKAYYEANKEKLKAQHKAWEEANKEKRKVYREANKEKRKVQMKAWYEANKEKAKAWEESNREIRKVQMKAWDKANKDKRYAINANRRASKLNRTPSWLTKEDKEEIKEIYRMAKRRQEVEGIEYHVDHIIPLQGEKISGLHVPSNLQILRAKDNISKGNKYG